MNDLDPWKIWAFAAVQVIGILGTTEARVRSQSIGPASAQAVALVSSGNSVVNPTPSPDSDADSYTAYPSYIPNRSYRDAGYPGQNAIVPLSSLLYGLQAASALRTETYPEPVVDVTQEIVGDQSSQSDQVAAIENQISNDNYTSALFASDYTELSSLAKVDLSGLPPAEEDVAYDLDFVPAALDGGVELPFDLPGLTGGRITGLTLQSAILSGDMDISPEQAAKLVVSLRSDDPITVGRELGVENSVVTMVQNLAMSGEINQDPGDDMSVELGDDSEEVSEARTEAAAAEGEQLAQSKTQAIMQSLMRMRDEAAYNEAVTTTVGKVFLQLNNSQFVVQPQE